MLVLLLQQGTVLAVSLRQRGAFGVNIAFCDSRFGVENELRCG